MQPYSTLDARSGLDLRFSSFETLDQDVLPLHTECAHVQSISGVFSMASHWVLQYFPEVVRHEQTGCAHFSAFAIDIVFLLS